MATSKDHVVAKEPMGLRGPARSSGITRPAGRNRHVDEVLRDLSTTRVQYEDARVDTGARSETAQLRTRLHELRAEAASALKGGRS